MALENKNNASSSFAILLENNNNRVPLFFIRATDRFWLFAQTPYQRSTSPPLSLRMGLGTHPNLWKMIIPFHVWNNYRIFDVNWLEEEDGEEEDEELLLGESWKS